MNTRRHPSVFAAALMLGLLFWTLKGQQVGAATVVSGNVAGTWTADQSPYIMVADCTVVSNQTLTIQPGVTVIVLPEVYFSVSGGITAIGTPSQPIFIQGNTPTNYWPGIYITYSSFTNRFHHCRIRDTTYPALYFFIQGGNRTWTAEIVNCEFLNSAWAGIKAYVGSAPNGAVGGGSAAFNPDIHNCIFDSTSYGCIFQLDFTGPFPNAIDSFVNPRITGNVFKNLTLTALLFTSPYNNTNVSRPFFVNNTIVNAGQGVVTAALTCYPTISNNLFMHTTNAVHGIHGRADPLDTSYNCFFDNVVNFYDYPAVYGLLLQSNHNGDPCDVYSNIFLDPRIGDPNRYVPASDSPCIDAGDPAILDQCLTVSGGSLVSDIGAYGGPDGCNWVSAFTPEVAIQLYPGLSFAGLVGHTYSIEYVTNASLSNWIGLATNTLKDPYWIWVDTNVMGNVHKFYRVVLQR